MTTAVYFDLDGTLLAYDTPFRTLFDRAVTGDEDSPPGAAFETFSSTLLAALSEIHPAPYEHAFRAVRDEHGLDGDPATAAERFVDEEVAATRPVEGARRLVETVAARHPTGLLTNGHGPTQRRKAGAHGLDDLVEAVVVSNEVGARKPDAELFDRAREALPADGDADTHVYVGDTYEEDVVGAREAGWQAVYVGDGRREETPLSADGVGALGDVLVPLLD